METNSVQAELGGAVCQYGVPEDRSRLLLLESAGAREQIQEAVAALRLDRVVLLRNVDPADADARIAEIAASLQLYDELELQAGCASIFGHRKNIGAYYMTVSRRGEYQFIPSHSEGHRKANMQLAAFYCHENTTDGGVTILQNVDDASTVWSSMREVVPKIDLCGKRLSATEIAQAKVMYSVNLPDDVLDPEDTVLKERPCAISGVKYYEVLTKTRKAYSKILDEHVNVYWDSVGSTDHHSSTEYARLLQAHGLLRMPDPGTDPKELDQTASRKVWTSGIAFERLFKAKLVLRLEPGDLLVQNNLTWTHSASNWSPDSGIRRVAVAFA